jgi:hypothetical protein
MSGKLTLLLMVIALCAGVASAEDPADGETSAAKEPRFFLAVDWSYVDFSTTFEWVEAENGRRAFISLEGDLGLPASQSVPMLSLMARVGRKSYIAANVGRFKRSRTLLDVEKEIVLDDLVIEAGADVDLFFNVTDIDLSYGHAYIADDRVRIIGKFGASLLDLDIGLEGEGDYRFGDVSDSGEFRLATSLLVPVPLVGMTADVELVKNWVLTAEIDFFYGPFGDIAAKAWRSRIFVRHRFGRTVSVIFGYGTFDVEVVDKTDVAEATIDYRMSGFSAGLAFTF